MTPEEDAERDCCTTLPLMQPDGANKKLPIEQAAQSSWMNIRIMHDIGLTIISNVIF